MTSSPLVLALCLVSLVIGLLAVIPNSLLILLEKQRYRKQVLLKER
jgi:hypothetical protein